jgi:D-lyxose ketol-isomerase
MYWRLAGMEIAHTNKRMDDAFITDIQIVNYASHSRLRVDPGHRITVLPMST